MTIFPPLSPDEKYAKSLPLERDAVKVKLIQFHC